VPGHVVGNQWLPDDGNDMRGIAMSETRTASSPGGDGSIDLLDGEWYASQPWHDWERLRHQQPAYHDVANDVWAVTRYHDVLAIEKDPATFSSVRAPRPHGNPMPMMISMDDPLHARRRKLVSKGFTPRRVRDHENTIRRICTEIIDRVCERGSCDFVADIAAPLPLLLIADLLGFPPESYDDLLAWSDDLLQATVGRPEAMEAALHAAIAFREFQMEVIADRRARPPADDLVSILCHAEIDGERLDDESIVMESMLILIGGDETSRHVIADGMLALCDNPGQRQALAEGSIGMDTAVEELLRWVTPIKNMARTVTRNVEVAGSELPEGAQVLLMYPSANRDDAVFDEPDRFDLTRDPNPHLAFGFGPHFCMGASLARLEVRVMVEELLRRLPDLEVSGPVTRRASNFISGPETMPVVFSPSAPEGRP
jgi:cholest-4-en-3-one 26-monooxygenase